MPLSTLEDYFSDSSLPDELLRALHESKIAAFERGVRDSRDRVPHNRAPFAMGGAEWVAWSAGYWEGIESHNRAEAGKGAYTGGTAGNPPPDTQQDDSADRCAIGGLPQSPSVLGCRRFGPSFL